MTDQTERLKSSVKELSGTRREIEAELRAEDVAQEHERVLGLYAGRVKLKGFRQGKAPKDIVKRMFAADIQKSVLDELIPQVLHEVLESRRIQAVGSPLINDIVQEAGGPLKFKATVEVWPDFELPSYKKIPAKKKGAVVGEEDVDRALAELREKAAEYVPVEGRGVASGDYVVIELQGKDLKTKRLMPTEKVVVLAGHEGNDPAINENLPDLKPGEEKTFNHAYPADHKAKKLAGKSVEYRLKVDSIKEKRLPELNDDFAKTLGEFENLAGVKDKIRQEIQGAREQAGRRETADEIVRTVVDRAAIELPESAVEEETEAVLKNMLSSLPAKQLLTKELVEALQGSARKQAEANLRRHVILRKIADAEAIRVGEEEVDQEIKALAQANNIPLARASETFNQEDRRENLKNSLLLRKTVDFLLEQAIME
ncbi:MAG: trigger factor [Candidatus Aminicenantes bacterium]|nr:trigger factor [Candidatus Aminicenantes bacterium]